MVAALWSRCVNRPIELPEKALLGGCAAGTSCQQRRIPEYRQVAPFEAQLTGLDVAVYQFRLHGTAVTRAEGARSEEHTSELQSRGHLVCRLLLEKIKK